MEHRDVTVAGRTRRLCASPTAGINGRSSPSRANRIREYREPSTGSRFRKTERNGNADDAWGCPFSHGAPDADGGAPCENRSEEHTSELQSHLNLVCRLLLEKKKNKQKDKPHYKTMMC